MASQLGTIIGAVAGMAISGYTMTVYRGSTLRNSMESADIPARIISAVGMQSNRTVTRTLGGSGHLMQTEWTITDVALLRPAGQGIGLRDIALNLEGYMAAYHDASRTLIGPTWTVQNLSLRAQVLEWPQASGRMYDVVTASLIISEIIQ